MLYTFLILSFKVSVMLCMISCHLRFQLTVRLMFCKVDHKYRRLTCFRTIELCNLTISYSFILAFYSNHDILEVEFWVAAHVMLFWSRKEQDTVFWVFPVESLQDLSWEELSGYILSSQLSARQVQHADNSRKPTNTFCIDTHRFF